MDTDVIVQLINSMGFPIVMCGALFWKMTKDEKTNRENIDNMVDAVNNNTNVITKLILSIDHDKED